MIPAARQIEVIDLIKRFRDSGIRVYGVEIDGKKIYIKTLESSDEAQQGHEGLGDIKWSKS